MPLLRNYYIKSCSFPSPSCGGFGFVKINYSELTLVQIEQVSIGGNPYAGWQPTCRNDEIRRVGHYCWVTPHGLHQVCGWVSLSYDEWQRRQHFRVSCFVQPGQQPLRGRVFAQSVYTAMAVIVEHILGTITTLRNRYSVGPPEIPAIQVIFCN